MTRKPLFWVVFAVLAAIGAVFAARLFPVAMPMVTLDLRMDRSAALEQASALAQEHGWGPSEFRQAAEFGVDTQLQSFVELEAGGNEAFARLLHEGPYSPYTWSVRHFRVHETNETLVRFTPAGAPYGFREKLAEDAPGARLEAAAARTLAEERMKRHWAVDLERYSLVEAAQEVRPGGRVDHTLVYEMRDTPLGEGRYRLRAVVSGDRLSELTRFVKIPEAFGRRYQQMRSANDAIAYAATAAIIVLYGAIVVIGLFLLLKRRFVLWRPAAAWAAVVGTLLFAVGLAQWPLAWMQYDTADSATGFAFSHIAQALAQGLGMGLLCCLTFMAGESLSRRAFPHQIQLWRAWSKNVAATRSVLGGTLGAYLGLGLMFAYIVGLYLVARRYFGWWLPSEALTDPNVVATYFPWLPPIAISLEAGFMEESLFRAVPLAAAALLGQRFGGRRIWIGVVLVLQAVIFGAAHANYPAQPAYARVIEIAIPFLLLGLVYIRFGLLPVIVLHFLFDVVFFALPVFASKAPGVWLDQALVILLALVPVWALVLARLRSGATGDTPEQARNGAWVPPALAAPVAEGAAAETTPERAWGRNARLALAAAGVLGLVVWAGTSRFVSDAPRLKVGRAAAEVAARRALETRGLRLAAPWRELSAVAGDVGLADRFVWQVGGPEVYRAVIGSHIEAPHWVVRYARFEGDVVERAEEWAVHVGSDGQVTRVVHTWPEGRPGKSLSEDEARTLARGAVNERLGLDPAALKEVSAEPAARPARRDWRFVFSNPKVTVGGKGEARIEVWLTGDEVTDVFPFTHVPEDWRRAEQERATVAGLVGGAVQAAFVLTFLAAAVVGIIRWSRGQMAVRTFVQVGGGLALLACLLLANRWPSMTAAFSSSKPWGVQAATLGGFGVIGAWVLAAIVALIIGLAQRWTAGAAGGAVPARLGEGAALGAVWAGLGAVVGMTATARTPHWPSLGDADGWVAALGTALAPVNGWVRLAAVLLFVFTAVEVGTGGWRRRRGLFGVVLAATGLVFGGLRGVEDVSSWLVAGVLSAVVLGLSYVLVLRRRLVLLPVATATSVALGLAREAVLDGYPGATAGAVVGIVVLVAVAVWWQGRYVADQRRW